MKWNGKPQFPVPFHTSIQQREGSRIDRVRGVVCIPENPLTMSDAIKWTPEAEARLKEIPFFVRPAARKKIEKFAQEAGIAEITEAVYEQAKQRFGSN